MKSHRRGFTLIELMTVVAIVAVLSALSVFGFTRAVRNARQSGERFELIGIAGFARSRALAVGADVYLVFAGVESTEGWPDPGAPRVLVYQDPEQAVRASLDDLLSVVEAPGNGANVRERKVAGENGLFFFSLRDGSQAEACDASRAPAYVPITGDRRTTRGCATSFCSFCEDQNGVCVGAVRFGPDGLARIVTGPAGSGGLLRLVDPNDPTRSRCLAVSEPAGLLTVLPD